MRTLLELGADPNYGDHAGFPALIAALSSDRADRYELLELLLSFGADPGQRGLNDWTPLHYAAAHDDVEGIKLLLARGADRPPAPGSTISPRRSRRPSASAAPMRRGSFAWSLPAEGRGPMDNPRRGAAPGFGRTGETRHHPASRAASTLRKLIHRGKLVWADRLLPSQSTCNAASLSAGK